MEANVFVQRCLILLLLIFPTISQATVQQLENEVNSSTGTIRVEKIIELSNAYFDISAQKGFQYLWKTLADANMKRDTALLAKVYTTLGVYQQRTSNYDSALYYYKKSIEYKTDNIEIAKTINNIGVLYNEFSDFDNAIKYHKNALTLSETISDKHGVASALNHIGNVYQKQGKYEEALTYYNQSLEQRKIIGNAADIAASHNNIGDVYKKMNNYEQALAHLLEALDMFEKANDTKSVAYTLNGIGNFYLQIKIYDKAREYYSKSLALRETLNDKGDIATSLNNIGTVHRDLENYDKALEYYQRALDIRKAIGNKEAVASSLNNIGGLYWKKGIFHKAIEYYTMVLDICEQVGNKALIASSLKNIGIIYKETSNYEKSLEYYQRALDEYFLINDARGIAMVQNLKGNVYRKMNEPDKAIEFYNNARAMYEQDGNLQSLAYIENNLGELYMEMNKLNDAIDYFDKAIDHATPVQEKQAKEQAYKNLALIFEKIGNHKKSLDFYKQFTAIKDSIANDMNKRRIAEIEFESAIKSKDNEIKIQESQLQQKEEKISQQRLFLIIGIVVILMIIGFLILIYFQYKQKIRANKIIEEKSIQLEHINHELEVKNDKITDSITYAKRIQSAILPSTDILKHYFPQSFVFYRPKEIVSGDFYWFCEQNGKLFIATVDCTGHGVPGAFMSMIGNTLLNEIIINSKTTDTAEILTKLDAGVIKALKQDIDNDMRQEDGMDMSLICIHMDTKTIDFSGANHKLYIIENGELKSIEGDIFSIGGMVKIKKRKNAKFTKKTIPYSSNTTVYMLSDGYIDQFGGEKNERFMTRRFQETILKNQTLAMHEQYIDFANVYDNWKGNQKQIDDVTLIGIRF